MIEIVHEAPELTPAIEALLDCAFGRDRMNRVSYRLREHNQAVIQLCFVALVETRPVAVVRFFPVSVGAAAALLLGPLAVAPEHQGRGIGSTMVRHALAAAATAGYALIVAVGEPRFFGRFGFRAAPRLVMPGPVQTRRLLALAAPGTVVVAGPVRHPAPASAAPLSALRATIPPSARRAAGAARSRRA